MDTENLLAMIRAVVEPLAIGEAREELIQDLTVEVLARRVSVAQLQEAAKALLPRIHKRLRPGGHGFISLSEPIPGLDRALAEVLQASDVAPAGEKKYRRKYSQGNHPSSIQALRHSRKICRVRSQSPEAKKKRRETRAAKGLDRDPRFLDAAVEGRKKGHPRAVEAARQPGAKRKRAESCRRWREANPGVPGSKGITIEQRVRLFFLARPEATNQEVAAALGRSPQMIARFRDPASVKPYKRDLLRKIAASTSHASIVKFFAGSMPPCPTCGEPAHRVHYDTRLGGRPVGHCRRCARSFVTHDGFSVVRPPVRVEPESIRRLLDMLAAGKALTIALKLARIPLSTGDKIADLILTNFGGYKPGDWRQSNRFRGRAKDRKS